MHGFIEKVTVTTTEIKQEQNPKLPESFIDLLFELRLFQISSYSIPTDKDRIHSR